MLNQLEIINEAKNQTGLANFGNPLFMNGFEALISSINQEADLNEIGVEAQKHRLIGILSNILRIENALMENPKNFGGGNQVASCNCGSSKDRKHYDS